MKRLFGRLGRYFRVDIYRRVLPFVKPYRPLMAVVVGLALVQAGFGVLDPWPMQILIDNALSGKPLPGWLQHVFHASAGGHANGAAIVVFAVVAGIVLRLTGNLLDVYFTYLKAIVNDSIVLDFKASLFNHLQRLSFSYHDQTSVGDSMYRLNADTGFISALVWGNFRHLLVSGITLVAILVITIRLDWQLALLALISAPLVYASIGRYGGFFKDKSKHVKSLESASHTVMQEVLSCLRVVKAFGMEEREQRRFEERSWAALRARLRLSLQQSLFSTGVGFVTKLNRSLILLIGGLHVLQGRLSIGELLVILSYVGQIHGPLEDIGETLTDMQVSLASAERALEVLDTEPEIQDRPGAITLERVEGAFTFEDASFAYRSGHPVLRDIDFAVAPGEVVAIVGPTGAGKTTLASLAARFYDPGTGRVTLDGHDLRDLTVRTLRDNIALVIQEPILFTGTIRENIAYGRLEAGMDEIEEAARAANAHDFITALPDGYDSQVGERGVRLSGGERQRIAIARAFLKDAPVLILDEPTSSVDSRTEQVILDALDRLMVGRTTFIIAHRLSTIRCADQILVLEKGRIVERGTHEELLERDGLYAQLYRIQFGALRQRRRVEGPHK